MSTRKLSAAILVVIGLGQALALTLYLVHLYQVEYNPQYVSPCEQGRQNCQMEAEQQKAKGDDVVEVDGVSKWASEENLKECLAEFGRGCEVTEQVPLAQDLFDMGSLGVASWLLALVALLGAKYISGKRPDEAK